MSEIPILEEMKAAEQVLRALADHFNGPGTGMHVCIQAAERLELLRYELEHPEQSGAKSGGNVENLGSVLNRLELEFPRLAKGVDDKRAKG